MWKECAEQRTCIQGREEWGHLNDVNSGWVRIRKVRDRRESVLQKGTDCVVWEIWKLGVGLVGGGILSIKILKQLKRNLVEYNPDLCLSVLLLSFRPAMFWLENLPFASSEAAWPAGPAQWAPLLRAHLQCSAHFCHGPSWQEGHWGAGSCPEKGNRAGEGAAAQVWCLFTLFIHTLSDCRDCLTWRSSQLPCPLLDTITTRGQIS